MYTDGSVTKDQSGWGFTDKQGAITFTKTVQPIWSQPPAWQWRWKHSPMPSAGLPQEVAVGPHHAILLTDSVSLLQKVKSGMGSPDWNVLMVDIHLRNLWVYCPGHAGVKGNDWADRLAGKATLTSGLLLGRSEVLMSLRHYLRAQSQGHHTIDRLEERGVERGSARRSSLKGRERDLVNQTNIGIVSKATSVGEILGHGVFREHRYHLEPIWKER